MNEIEVVCRTLWDVILRGILCLCSTVCCILCATDNVIIEGVLYHAAYNGNFAACHFLCMMRLSQRVKEKYAADHNPYGSSPLHVAVRNGHLRIVRLFVVQQKPYFNVNQTNNEFDTPLFYARDSEEMSRLLLENGADPNLYFGPTAMPVINHAVVNEYANVVCLLLDYGACQSERRSPASSPGH